MTFFKFKFKYSCVPIFEYMYYVYSHSSPNFANYFFKNRLFILRSRSYSRDYERDRPGPSSSKTRGAERPQVSEADLEGKSPDEQEMMKVMGFCGFDTTKGKKVDGNEVGDVHVILKRKYRQYMNRKGGFNRPLDFVA